MTFNSEEIIGEVRAEFEQALALVSSEAAYQCTADQMERSIFKQLLKLGAQLLVLFFVLRAERSRGQQKKGANHNGKTVRYHQQRKRDYLSIFGEVPIWRAYYYEKGIGGVAPLDEELSLADDKYSDMVREMVEYLAAYGAYNKATEIMGRFFNLALSTATLQRQVLADGEEVAAFYEQKAAPAAESEREILVVQADGKGIPIINEERQPQPVRLGKGQKRGRKREAIVTSAYTIAATPRTPQAVLASYYKTANEQPTSDGHATPQNKAVWATLRGKDQAISDLAAHAQRRLGPHLVARLALCDGCEALQSRLIEKLSLHTLILDFIHANEYLWQVVNVLYGEESPQRLPWMISRSEKLLTSQTASLIKELRELAEQSTLSERQRDQLQRTANYFERNLPYMDYSHYLAQGWPIASGVIEGACRHFVKDRCELSGMRWTVEGAEQLLNLRAVAVNDDWDQFHKFRKVRRHAQLYNSPLEFPASAELLALAA